MRQPAQQLGVIRTPELLVGRRPRPVVNEIAVRIEPDVERQHADHDSLFVADFQMAGHPTPLASCRAVPFEDRQKIGVEEGMARRTEASPYVARDGVGGMAGGYGEIGHRTGRILRIGHLCCFARSKA